MSINQKIFLHKDKIEIEDARFYKTLNDEKQEVFVPSVTTVLSAMPKGFGFNEWLKSNGFNADTLLEKAARKGTKIHEACENLLNGIEVNYFDAQEGRALYSWDEWKQIEKFYFMAKATELKLIEAPEFNIVSFEMGVGGTIDIVAEIGGLTCLLDIKTGANLWQSHELQLATYSKMYEWKTGNKIDRTGIIHLDARTRTEKIDFKKMVFQGVGWQIKFVDKIDENYELFKSVKEVFDNTEIGKMKPKVEQMPTSFKL